jgi:arsenate reductase (glutaredoxin)
MIQIYHNNRCSKSRCALKYLEDTKVKFEIISYLEEAPSIEELENLTQKLNLHPIEFIRKNETIYKENYKGKQLSNAKWLQVMHENPILIERPIIVGKKSAIIGRPPELALEFLKTNS